MADTATNTRSGDPVSEVARLILYWIVAFLIFVAALGLAWRAGAWFVAILVAWLVLVMPLALRTIGWLRAREHEDG